MYISYQLLPIFVFFSIFSNIFFSSFFPHCERIEVQIDLCKTCAISGQTSYRVRKNSRFSLSSHRILKKSIFRLPRPLKCVVCVALYLLRFKPAESSPAILRKSKTLEAKFVEILLDFESLLFKHFGTRDIQEDCTNEAKFKCTIWNPTIWIIHGVIVSRKSLHIPHKET